MGNKKRILLKLTGEVFLDSHKILSPITINNVIEQIKKLHATHQFGIVIGGGNFFRGNNQGKALGMTPSVGHQTGMIATMMNGLILKDLLEQHGLDAALLCAISCPEVGESISHQNINTALSHDRTIIFTGGTGNPFFTNDTNAIIRGLQIEAAEIWKATNVGGVYNTDPRHNPDAALLKKISFSQAITERYGIMDPTAFVLAEQYRQQIRVFNIFTPDALMQAARDTSFGTTIFD